MSDHNRGLRGLAIFALLFGLATIVSGGRTLFDAEVRAAAEPVVPFVLGFNFVAGFAYVAAGIGLWLARRWAGVLAILIAVSTLLVLAGFGIHVLGGGAYAMRTVVAILFRSVAWCVIAVVSHRRLISIRSLSPR